ncbi:hypothetical protein FHS29_003649 [Saccharothrix tamanrassetensis]|uniref:Uncharacterized protein n=1 Tax=Saccharothrix tamanrassetensis TaxID=1051531 RepID=A0A841CND4_9PSEU|nr:hypothetical protein [Saccharothrix tamanrassetensis]MBB5957056.1 hypothetical protein [Saccharothrix tamanrassetensis]
MSDHSGAARLVAAVGLVAILAGCASETPGTPVTTAGTPVASGLTSALAKVRATEESAVLVEYGDVAAVRELVRRDRQRFQPLQGVGYSDIAARSDSLAGAVGFDPANASEAIRVGQPPNWAGVLRMEVDAEAVNGKFAGLGAQRVDGPDSTTWITAADHEVRLTGELGRLGIVSGFNKVRVAPDSIAFGPSGTSLAWVVDPGTGPSLAQDEVVGGLAACLGEVTVAMISKSRRGGPAVAVGVRATKDEVTEFVCVPDENPAALRDRVQARLDSPTADRGGQVWSTVFRDAEAEVPADRPGTVRVVAPADSATRVGRVLQALQRNDLAALFS